MYPSETDKYYGIFVRNIENTLSERGVVFTAKALIKGRAGNTLVKLAAYIKFYFEILWYGFSGKYDYIYVHFVSHAVFPLIILRWFKRVKIIVHIHGGEIFPLSAPTRLLHRFSGDIVATSCMIIVPSSFFKEETMRSYGLSGSNIVISASGGIVNKFFVQSKLPSGKLKIGYVGRIDPGKGWDVLLQSICVLRNDFKQLDFEVSFVGDGANTMEFKKAIDDLRIQELVNYRGPLSHEELPAFYEGLHLFIFPSVLPESLGLVGIEAMAAGLPVIGSDYGGIKEYLVDKYNGFTFEKGNSTMLAEKIYTYFTLSSENKRFFRENAIHTATKFSSDKVADNLMDAIRSMHNG